jgi:hypothetical protein
MIRFLTSIGRDDSGQALIESSIFLPVLLLALFGLLFFSRLGVLDERAQMAARYGGNVAYQKGQLYTISTLQDLIAGALQPSSSQLAVFCVNPTGPSTNTVQAAASDALTENQGNVTSSNPSAGLAGPSAQSFWKPTSAAGGGGSCSPTSVSLSQGASSPVVPLSMTGVVVAGTVAVPTYLSFLYNGSGSAGFLGQWNVVNLGLPTTLIACNVPLLDVLEIAVAPASPVTGTTPPGCPAAAQ